MEYDTIAFNENVEKSNYSIIEWEKEVHREAFPLANTYRDSLMALMFSRGLSRKDFIGEVMKRCSVTYATAISWLRPTDIGNRFNARLRIAEIAIVLGLSVAEANDFLLHQNLEKLDKKNPGDVLLIYYIENGIFIEYELLRKQFKEFRKIKTKADPHYIDSLAFSEEANESADEIELEQFLDEHGEFLRNKALNLERGINEWMEDSTSINECLSNQWDYTRRYDDWLTISQKRGAILPSREKTILLCLKLRMPVKKVNECLVDAGFMPLYSKEPLEGALIVLLNSLLAVSSCLSNERVYLFGTMPYDPDVLRDCVSPMKTNSRQFDTIWNEVGKWKEKSTNIIPPTFSNEDFMEIEHPESFLLETDKSLLLSVENYITTHDKKYLQGVYRMMRFLSDERNKDGVKTYIRYMINYSMHDSLEDYKKYHYGKIPAWLEAPMQIKNKKLEGYSYVGN